MPGTISVAARIAALLERCLGAPPPVRLRAWDGSDTGPAEAPVAVIHTPRALRRLLWDPGELGLARAYVTGDLDVDGDLVDGLRRCHAFTRRLPEGIRLSTGDRIQALRTAVRLGAVGPRPAPPATEAKLSGTPHTRRRDRDAIEHHYDLSNAFYRTVLEDSMAYSCAYWTSDDPGYTIADAQRDKLDLICHKLGLRPGMRLLDVGCGWGSLLVHAAHHYGVHATGVTLSTQQRDYVHERVRATGLDGAVQVRLQDYREVDDEPYDAVASIEMGEHVGTANYPTYATNLYRLLRPEGQLLLQQMSRGPYAPGGGPFIENYIAPDMEMTPLSHTVGMLEDAGFEIRDVESLREHYVRTALAWAETVEKRWDELLALVGEQQTRTWRLYLAGGALSFEENRMGVNQIHAARTSVSGRSGTPPTREPWRLPPIHNHREVSSVP